MIGETMRQHGLMATHSFVEVGQLWLLASRESYIPDIAALFTEMELRDEGERYGYVSSVGVLRDRLQLHGFTAKRALKELETAVGIWHGSMEPNVLDLGVTVQDAAALLAELGAAVNTSNPWVRQEEPQEVFWQQLETRTILRLALDVAEDQDLPVRYQLDDLASHGFLERGVPITDQAREERRENVAKDAPLVVLTEGSSDSQLLTEAVRVTHPHLDGFLRFMDFSGGAEGSVSNLAKLVRSFVGAGIANRVIALADNDSAAHDALDKLKREGLPDGYRILHYPDLPLLVSYPTLGPQSNEPIPMNVNGMAGSLEMYLGRELLLVDGALVPVQWTNYVSGRRSYQGSISPQEKSRVHAKFRDKVSAARRDPTVRNEQDWSGIKAIVEAVLAASGCGDGADGGASPDVVGGE